MNQSERETFVVGLVIGFVITMSLVLALYPIGNLHG